MRTSRIQIGICLCLCTFGASRAMARPLVECIRESMLYSSLEPRGLTMEQDRMVHGSHYTRKALRTMIFSARPSEHGFKHEAARTFAQAQKMSLHVAQYLPDIHHLALERSVLNSAGGEWFNHGNATLFKIERLDQSIGFDGGKATRWIRVELSSGYFHGQPISVDRVRNYIPWAEP